MCENKQPAEYIPWIKVVASPSEWNETPFPESALHVSLFGILIRAVGYLYAGAEAVKFSSFFSPIVAVLAANSPFWHLLGHTLLSAMVLYVTYARMLTLQSFHSHLSCNSWQTVVAGERKGQAGHWHVALSSTWSMFKSLAWIPQTL